MFDLSGHVALITGGNGGIGLAFARGLVKSGARVLIWGRDERKNAAALAELGGLGGEARAFRCDVTEPARVREVFAASLDCFGKVDSCFANAGGAGRRGPLQQMDLDNWRGIVELNLNGVVYTCQPFIEHLLERDAPGKIVITSSVAALLGMGLQASYAATKAAVLGLARSLAVELGRSGITANALLPGFVETELSANTPQAFKDAAMRRACLGRIGTTQDMEGVAVFLASRHSDFMTGHGLVIDGGHTVHPM